MGKIKLFINKLIKKIKLGSPACRGVQVFNGDVFLVSYPRSGNTWLRFMLGKLLYNIDVDFVNKEEVIPDIYKNSNKQLKKIKSPRILKSHEFFDERYNKVIYIYRDPRDVMISYHKWYQKYKGYNKNIDEFETAFVSGELDEYGRWDEHVIGWIDGIKNKNNLLVLRYEDIKVDTKKQLKKILKFLSVERSDKQIEDAILWSSISRMSSLEKQQQNISIEFKDSRKDIKFIKGGGKNSWNEVLNDCQISKINASFGAVLKRLGY